MAVTGPESGPGRPSIDKGSRVLELGFGNLSGLDYRLSAAAMSAISQSYPQGSVPGAMLGVVR